LVLRIASSSGFTALATVVYAGGLRGITTCLIRDVGEEAALVGRASFALLRGVVECPDVSMAVCFGV
jgi:hypothetical protein